MSGRTRRARRSERDAILAADQAAFDDFWHLDGDGLREAARATPSSHLRVTARGEHDDRLAATRCSGEPRSTGTCSGSRCAPKRRAAGSARALVTDGLNWLRQRGAARAYVNTQSDNDRALRAVRTRRLPAVARRPVRARTNAVNRGRRRALLRRARAARGEPRFGRSHRRRATPTAADPQFALLDQQPAWVNLGGDVLLRLDVPAALLPGERTGHAAPAHPSGGHDAATRSTARSKATGSATASTRRMRSTVQRLYRDAQGAVLVAFGLAGSTREPALDIRSPGVYPLEVALRTDETLAVVRHLDRRRRSGARRSRRSGSRRSGT